jgi:hypothetical protein
VLADLGPNPVGGVGDEPAFAVRIEARGGLEEPQVALLNDILHRNTPAAVFARDHENEGKARLDQALARPLVARAVALGELALFLCVDLWVPRDRLAVSRQRRDR